VKFTTDIKHLMPNSGPVFIYLFICGLFHDAANKSDYAALYDKDL